MQTRKNVQFLYTILIMLLIFTFLFNMTGCGYVTAMRNACHIDKQTCDNLFGPNNWEMADRLQMADRRLEASEHQNALLQTELTSLKSMVELLISESADYTKSLSSLTNLLLQLQNDSSASAIMLTDLRAEIQQVAENVDRQQAIINDMVGDITELQSQDTILEYILPCDERLGIYDEAIMRTKSGKLIAYFENGGDRFLTILTAGAYRTSDTKPQCQFTVDANLHIINARRQ